MQRGGSPFGRAFASQRRRRREAERWHGPGGLCPCQRPGCARGRRSPLRTPLPAPAPPPRFHLGEAEPLPQAPGTPGGGGDIPPPRRWEAWPCPRSRRPLGPGSPGGSEPGWPEAPLAAGGCKGHRRDATAHCSRAAEDVNQHPDGGIRQRAARRAAWPSCTQGTAYQKNPTNQPQTPPNIQPQTKK